MRATQTSRREFFPVAAGAVAAAWATSRSRAAEAPSAPALPSKAVRLGGPVFKAPQDPEELALAHRKLREHMANAQEYDRSRQFLFDVGQKIGVRFG